MAYYAVIIRAPMGHWMYFVGWQEDGQSDWGDSRQAFLFRTKADAETVTARLGFGIEVPHLLGVERP